MRTDGMIVAAFALAILALGCGPDDRSILPPASSYPRPSIDAAASTDSSTGTASDARSDSASEPDVQPSDAGPSFGGLPVVEVVGDECVPATTSDARILYSAELASSGVAPAIDRVDRVGEGRVAGGNEAQGFVTFDAAGVPGPLVSAAVDFNLFASEGDAIAVAGASFGEVVLRRFDEHGTPFGAALVLAAATPDALAIGAAASTSLVVWASGGSLVARTVVAGEPAGEARTIAEGTYVSLVSVTAGASADSFAIAWTGDDASAVHHTRLAVVSNAGVAEPPSEVLATSSVVRVVRVVRTTTGWALLVRAGAPDRRAYVVLLDAVGRPLGPAHALVGTAAAWDLASRGDAIAIVAPRHDGAPAVRAFSIDAGGGGALHPLGPWACLDEGGGAGHLGAIDVDGDGWLVVHRTKDGATRVARVSRSASAAP